MSLLHLALAYVAHRRLVSALTTLSIALGVALLLVVINVRRQLETAFLLETGGYDLVLGNPGSELALVLAGLYYSEAPRGNIPYRTVEQFRGLRGVTAAFPMALGDLVRSVRVVGVEPAFLQQVDRAGQPVFPLAQGKYFDGDLQLVAGATAAAQLGLRLDQTVISDHAVSSSGDPLARPTPAAAATGSTHTEFPYRVVGILQPTGTPNDRVLFTTLGSYWRVHGQAGEGREVSLALARTVRPMVFQLAATASSRWGILAVRPAAVLQRMFEQVLDPVERLLILYGYAVIVVAVLSILTTLYLATLGRRHDLALLRALGAAPREIFLLVLLEAGVFLLIGTGLGALASQAVGSLLRPMLQSRLGVAIVPMQFAPEAVYALASVFLLGLLAALAPARMAYRNSVAEGLRRG